jgi:hypothetical protein
MATTHYCRLALASDSELVCLKVKVQVTLWLTVSRPVYLGVKPHLGPKIIFSLLSDSCGFVDVGRPLWREDRSVIYTCCWPSPAQSWPYFTLSNSRFPHPGGQGPRIYTPQEEGGPIIPPPDTGFLFRRLLRLAGIRWRYSIRPPHGLLCLKIKVKVNFTTDGLPPIC